MPRRSSTSRTAPATPPITTARARRPRQTAPAATPAPAPEPIPATTPEPTPTPEPVPAATPAPAASDSFQQRVQTLLDLVSQGPDAIAEALRRGAITVKMPRAGRSGSRAPRNGLPCSVRQGTYLLHLAEHGTFQKGTSKVRSELHRLGLTDSDATDARLTDQGKLACEALRAAGVAPGGWVVQR
jgi:hypothetical protein